MCGIAGILYKADGLEGAIGQDLITMLDGCQHRGPDSTGFALYHETNGARILRLRFFVGEGAEAEEAISRIGERFGEFGAEIVEEESSRHHAGVHGSVRRRPALLLVRDGACRQGRARSARASTSSRTSAAPTTSTTPTTSAEFTGTHGIGHVRLATESDVTPEAGAPVLGDRLRRRRDRPQRSDHELLEDAAAPREARHGVPHRQRLRADRRLPRRQDGSGHPARRGARILDPRHGRDVLVPRLDEGRDRLREGQPRRQADGHVRGRRTSSRSPPRRSRSTASSRAGRSRPPSRPPARTARGDDRSSRRLGHRGEPLCCSSTEQPARTSTSSTRTPATTSASASPTRSPSASAARPATSARA